MNAPFTYNPFDDASGQQFLGWLQQHGGLPFNALGAGIGVKFVSQDVDLVTQQNINGLVILTGFLQPEVGAVPLFIAALVTETVINQDETFPGLNMRQGWFIYNSDLPAGRVLQITDSDNMTSIYPLPFLGGIPTNGNPGTVDLDIGTNDTLFASGKLKVGLWYLGML